MTNCNNNRSMDVIGIATGKTKRELDLTFPFYSRKDEPTLFTVACLLVTQTTSAYFRLENATGRVEKRVFEIFFADFRPKKQVFFSYKPFSLSFWVRFHQL